MFISTSTSTLVTVYIDEQVEWKFYKSNKKIAHIWEFNTADSPSKTWPAITANE